MNGVTSNAKRGTQASHHAPQLLDILDRRSHAVCKQLPENYPVAAPAEHNRQVSDVLTLRPCFRAHTDDLIYRSWMVRNSHDYLVA